MSKRTQEESGEERVTAKSKPMMNLVSRCSERTPNVLPSTASESPVVCPQGGAHTSKHVSPVNTRTSFWKKKKITIERWDPLFALSERLNSLLKTTKQNQICRWDPDHSCTGWMIRCEKDKNNPQWMQQKTVKSILWYGECSCLQHCKHLYSWERITQTIGIPSRIQKISQWNKFSTFLRNWCPNKMRSMEWIRLFRFCIVSSWDDREPSIKYGMGRQIDMVQKFTEIHNFGQTWWWANWIRVEHLPRIRYVAAQSQSSEVIVKIERNTREFYRKNHLHVDFQRHLMVIKRQQDRMRVKCSTRFSICKKIWSRTMVISPAWFREKVVF